MRKRKKLARGLSTVIYVGAVTYLVYLLVRNGGSTPALAVSIIVALTALLGQIGLKPGQSEGGKTVQELASPIRENIKDLWGKEAKARRLDGLDLMPVRLMFRDTGTAMTLKQKEKGRWSSAEYRKVASDVVLVHMVRRAVVYGNSGGGKTTFALMLTNGLVEHSWATVEECQEADGGFLPLLLSLSSWDPREDFTEWFGRTAIVTYPELKNIEIGEGTLLQRLVNSGKALLVLDGLDELPRGEQGKALEQIDREVLLDQPVIVLCRNDTRRPAGEGLTGGYLLNIVDADAGIVESYLRALTFSNDKATQHWQPVLKKLRDNPDSELTRLLQTPLFSSLAWNAYRDDNAVPERLVELTSATGGVSKAKEFLLDGYVTRQMNLAPILRRRRSMQWLEFIAHSMQSPPGSTLSQVPRHPMRSLAWWRISRIVPQWVFAAAIGVAVGPAYRLALVLPEGLTRGFAVGCSTGFALGLLRGISPRPSAAVVTGGITCAMVAAIGGTRLGWPEVLPDIAEIGVAMSVVMLCKAWLAGDRIAGYGPSPRHRRVKVGAAIVATGTAAATAVAVMHAILPAVPLVTTPASVGRAVALGVTVATMWGHLLGAVDTPPRPSVIEFGIGRRFGRPWRHLSAAIVSAIAVGVAGGFVGGMNHGVDYGLRIALIFGLVAGLPIGVVGGLLRWLSQLDSWRVSPAASPQKTMRNDRIVAISSIVVLGTISAGSVGLLLGPLLPVVANMSGSAFRVSPFDGMLFGLALGMPFSALTTAGPAFFVSHMWLALTRRLPWRFRTFLHALHESELLRQEGALYQFRHDELQTQLAARYKSDRQAAPGG